MKKIFFMAAAASLMLVALGCSEDKTKDLTPTLPPIGEQVVITASAEQQQDVEVVVPSESSKDSRTTLSGNKVVWTANDQIRVFSKSNTTTNQAYTLQSGANTTEGEFAGTSVSGAKYAFYPLASYNSVSGNTITFTLPATQTYMANSFASGANPMLAQSDASEVLQFKNLCGAIKLKLTGTATISQIEFTTPDGKVAGNATVDAAHTENPAPVFSDAASKTITLSVPSVKLTSTATSFYFIVPSGTYAAGASFAITDTEGYTMTITTKSAITVNRAKVAPLKELAYTRPVAFPDANFRAVLTAEPHSMVLTADGTDIDINNASNKAKFNTTTLAIDCSSKSIASLAGIEYFTALTSLQANLNKLTTIDLSKNTKLIELQLHTNQLTSLTLDAQPNLAFINLHTNRLTSLTFGLPLTLATAFNCSRNQLLELDISMLQLPAPLTWANVGLGNQTDAPEIYTRNIVVWMTPTQITAWKAVNPSPDAPASPLYNARVYPSPK